MTPSSQPASTDTHPPWRILATAFHHGLSFLKAWHASNSDRLPARILHFVSISATPCSRNEFIQTANEHPELLPLAHELSAQWFGLTPGAHRLSFEGGRVRLTLHVRDANEVLRNEPFTVDEVVLDGAIGADAIKALARHCRRGTCVTAPAASAEIRRALDRCGFVLTGMGARFDPAWEPKGLHAWPQRAAADALVIGGGLAGAATAASLARRGWHVTVLDAARQPAAGASALPVGLLAPHYSPDDNLLSRLTQAGVRMTMREARLLLREGKDWSPTGALEHRTATAEVAPLASDASRPWSQPASARRLAQALLPPTACALWHEQAAWIKPSALVRAWLAHERIEWHGNARVSALRKDGEAWAAWGAEGKALGRASIVVVAAALSSSAMLRHGLVLHPVRGQVSWAPQPRDLQAPAFPVNGNGHFIPAVPHLGALAWFSGSSYHRDQDSDEIRAEDQSANHERLRSLLPQVAIQLEDDFNAGKVNAWSGVRCASADRRPLVGELEPGLWLTTAMGSRGLTFCALAGELIAACLHDEPLPIEHKMARSLDASRAIQRPGTAV